MTQALGNIIKQDGVWRINGAMGLYHVEGLLAQSAESKMQGDLIMDLSEVTEVDTASISLLMEWLRLARGQQCHLQYSNLPKNLVALATLYGVLDMIPVATNSVTAR